MLRIRHITKRFYTSDLKSALREAIPARREAFLNLKKDYGSKKLGDITVQSVIGGMRGNRLMYWESSVLDPNEGIRFHGKTIAECQKELPKFQEETNDPHSEFLPESMLWFLLTGQVPTQEQANGLVREMASRSELPEYVTKILDSLPKSLHPMTQLAIGVSALNNSGVFAKAYESGKVGKNDSWEYVYEDVLNLISKLPALTGHIYSNIYHNGKPLGKIDKTKDWSYNLSSLLGMTQESANISNLTEQQSRDFVNLVRLYCALHVDHEGGNVSAHATHLVGSALSDPYLSYSAGLQGLAGPLHGLAAQEVVRFIVEMNNQVKEQTPEAVQEYLWSVLNSKRVIPGYGHAVLRKADPRFDAMIQFGKNRQNEFANDEHFQMVNLMSKVAPEVLKEHGKTNNPYPNVDSASGVLFYHYGIKELLFITVIFGCSRSIGPLSQMIWDRILGMPIERPKSVDMKTIIKNAQ